MTPPAGTIHCPETDMIAVVSFLPQLGPLAREKTAPEQEVSAARWWVSRLERSTFADHVVDNTNRHPREVAAEVLHVLDWLK